MNWIDDKETIFGNGIVNIFCDASIRKIDSGETIGIPGAIYMSNDALSEEYGDKIYTITEIDMLRHSTNNHSEVYAILMAYQIAKRIWYGVGGNLRINIYSDSQISVFGLRDWIYGWMESSTGDTLISSSGKEVANQVIYKEIVNDMIRSQVPIYLYHTKGHVNVNSSKDINNAKRVFDKSNNTNISINAIRQISYGNDLVDVSTKDEINNLLRDNYLGTHTNNPIMPYDISIADVDMNEYRKYNRR